MKKILGVFVFIIIFSCSNEKENELPLFNGLTFQLNEGESIGEIDSKAKENYADYFNSPIQIPLFKYIKHSNYQIFIGLPYNTSIEAMTQYELNKQDSSIAKLKLKTDSISYYKEYEKHNFHITEYAVRKEGNSLIYIATLSDSIGFITSSDLSNRINLKD